MFNETITYFRHYIEETTSQGQTVRTDKWEKIIVDGVMVTRDIAREVDSDGKFSLSPTVKITIPYREGLTFNLDNLDIVFIGRCPKDITANYTITNLRKEYPLLTFTVSGFKDNTQRNRLKHWKVTVK